MKISDFTAPLGFAPLSLALRRTLPSLLACALSLNPPVLAAAAVEDEVPAALLPLDALVDDNRFADAYALAQTMLIEWEGEPRFDFLYGTAALESGHANEAIFAFERLVQNYPDEQRFKLELARAQFEQNNLAASRELFEEVRATDPDATVLGNIQAFLDAIDDRERATRSRLTWFVSSMLGNDTNINSATQLGVISTPIGDVELQPSGQAIEDTFLDLGGGLNYVRPLNKLATLNFNARYTNHNNLSTRDFDLDVFAADASYTRAVGNLRLSGGGRVQKVNLAGDSFQNSASLIATAQRDAGNGWTQLATLAYTGVRYDTGIAANADLRDVNQWLVSGVLSRTLGRFNHNLSVFVGDETARFDAGENNAQKFYGVAVIEQFQWRPGHIPYLRLSLQHSENKAPAPIFNVVREADLFSAAVGWQWRVNNRLSTNTDLTYIDNDANLDLYAYDRVRFQTGLRYQF